MKRQKKWRTCWKWAATLGAAGIALMWLASGWYKGWIRGGTQRWDMSLFVERGWVSVNCMELPLAPGSARPSSGPAVRFMGRIPHWGWAVRLKHGSLVTAGTYYAVQLPLWLPFLVFGGSAAWMWLRSPRLPGACPKCGYDLAGINADVCPECGQRLSARADTTLSRGEPANHVSS